MSENILSVIIALLDTFSAWFLLWVLSRLLG